MTDAALNTHVSARVWTHAFIPLERVLTEPSRPEGDGAFQCLTFPIWNFTSFPLVSFSSLIAMVMTSKTMLNNSGKTGHP